jgi:hypothetical protein
VSKVEELLEKCNEEIKSNRINLLIWSFMNNFGGIQEGISFLVFQKEDFEKFIEICNNRLDRSKVLLSEIAVVLGFDVTALSIIATLARTKEYPTIWSLIKNSNDSIFISLIIFLFGALIFLFITLAHYRSHTHAWTAFKEKAILRK